MTKTEAIKRAGSQAGLAKILDVKRQAVWQWGEKLPELQLYKLKERRPEWFKKEKK